MNINKIFGKMDYEEPEELSTDTLSEVLKNRRDMRLEFTIVGLLQSDTDAELKYGRNKLYWDGSQWIVLGRKAGVDSCYSLTLYEGLSEQKAVKALKGE